jgi:DNA-binding transcriptional regulator GbsR (MarR family)
VVARDQRDDAARRFTERFALLLTNSGMPRMPSRVFAALLVADEGRRTAAELAEFLQVSPAAISGAVRYLGQLEMIQRVREPGARSDHYTLFDDPWYEPISRRDKVMQTWHDALAEGAEAIGPRTPAGERLAESAEFFGYLSVAVVDVIKRWRDRQGR